MLCNGSFYFIAKINISWCNESDCSSSRCRVILKMYFWELLRLYFHVFKTLLAKKYVNMHLDLARLVALLQDVGGHKRNRLEVFERGKECDGKT